MRVIEAGVVLAFLLGCAALARAAWRAQGTSRPPGTWEPHHHYAAGTRRVSVRRGEEVEPVGEVASADPEYEAAFLSLMDRARERAAVLNSER